MKYKVGDVVAVGEPIRFYEILEVGTTTYKIRYVGPGKKWKISDGLADFIFANINHGRLATPAELVLYTS